MCVKCLDLGIAYSILCVTGITVTTLFRYSKPADTLFSPPPKRKYIYLLLGPTLLVFLISSLLLHEC